MNNPSRSNIAENISVDLAFELIDCGLWKYIIDSESAWISSLALQALEAKLDENYYKIDQIKSITGNDDLLKIFNPYPLISGHIDELQQEVKINFETSNNKFTKYYYTRSKIVVEGDKKIIYGIIKDITQNKRIEEELLKSKERTEEADKLKTAFLTNISHEIRTPLNSILGFVELMNIGEMDEEKKGEYLKIIKNKSKQLLTYIDDVIELNKLEFGETLVNRSATNIVKLLAEVFNEVNNDKILKNKQALDIFLNIPPGIELNNIFIDPGRLQQILKLLLNYSLSVTEKGFIQIAVELKDSKHLLFVIKDTGFGFSKEELKNIFNYNKIFDSSTTKSRNSFLIWLLIAKKIVENLGGKMQLQSTIAEGTVYSFTLPFSRNEKVSSEPQNEEKSILRSFNWKDKLILIAEDEEDNFRFLEAILDETKVKLIHVSNGQQAVDIFKSINNIDLILMDIRMPEMNGYEAVKEIKQLKPNIPIIAQTAYTLSDEQKSCIEAGCDDYISKPIEIETLLKKIARYLS